MSSQNEKPIIFSTPMVRAVLDGTKTQSRRVIKPQPLAGQAIVPVPVDLRDFPATWAVVEMADKPVDTVRFIKCPYGQVGDRLYLKESHKLEMVLDNDGTKWVKCSYRFEVGNDGEVRKYRWADLPLATQRKLVRIKTWNKWRSKRFMYKFLARVWLEITDIRAERLQDITEEDAKAEGIKVLQGTWQSMARDSETGKLKLVGEPQPYTARYHFEALWDSLNAKRKIDITTNLDTVYPYSWRANPWVFPISFKLI